MLEMLGLINKDIRKANEWIENEVTARGQGSFVRNSAAGINFEIKRTQTNLP
jgi:hypothetical protein